MPVKDPTNEWYSTSQQSAVTARPRRGVVLHHGATTSYDGIVEMETSGSRQVSSNRVVKDKRCGRVVADDPNIRAWSLSSAYWDSVLSSVECANESTNGWTISDESHETIAQYVAWRAQEEGWWPHREGDNRNWTVYGHREIYSIFGDSYATACPGGMNLDFITKRAQQILTGKPQGDIMELTVVYNDKDKNAKGYGSTGVITPVTGFVQTSVGLGPRDSLNAYRAIAGELGWPISDRSVDGNGWILSQLFAVPTANAAQLTKIIEDAIKASPLQVDEQEISKIIAPLLVSALAPKIDGVAAATEALLKDDFAKNATDSGRAARDAIVK